MDGGILIISLDFELNWGVHDVLPLEEYKENLLGVQQAVPRLLDLFGHYGIHATWGTVGLLFFETKDEMNRSLPSLKPTYQNMKFSPYEKMDTVGNDEKEDPFHYAPSLITQIAAAPFQEIGTHTFSHYYCLESGQTQDQFEADIKIAVEVAKKKNIEIKTVLFPRNQANMDYLAVCQKYGILTYRGNEQCLIYKPGSFGENQTSLKRLLRLADSYFNITGHHIYSPKSLDFDIIVNLPSSRFLRPYNPTLKMGDHLRLRRIKKSMTKAAKENKIYHLWWHPHNFGKHIDENTALLAEIFEHFQLLRKNYKMESLNMAEVGEAIFANENGGISQR